MDLSAYFRLLRRWLWLVLLAGVIGGSISFVNARNQPSRYQASITIQVGGYSNLANPNSGEISTAAQLAQTYAVLIKTDPILNGVIQNLQLGMSTGQLA